MREAVEAGFAVVEEKLTELIVENAIPVKSVLENCEHDRKTSVGVADLLTHFGTSIRPTSGPVPQTLLQIAFAHYTRAHQDSDNNLGLLKALREIQQKQLDALLAIRQDALVQTTSLIELKTLIAQENARQNEWRTLVKPWLQTAAANSGSILTSFRRFEADTRLYRDAATHTALETLRHLTQFQDASKDFQDSAITSLNNIPGMRFDLTNGLADIKKLSVTITDAIEKSTDSVSTAVNKTAEGIVTSVHEHTKMVVVLERKTIERLDEVLKILNARALPEQTHFGEHADLRQQIIRIRNILNTRLP